MAVNAFGVFVSKPSRVAAADLLSMGLPLPITPSRARDRNDKSRVGSPRPDFVGPRDDRRFGRECPCQSTSHCEAYDARSSVYAVAIPNMKPLNGRSKPVG